jgi:3',5'-cyclic AMP phosphodiesterase CpdA
VTIDVVQVSDLHVTESGELMGQDPRVAVDLLLDDIGARRLDPDLVVATGDLAHDGDPKAYGWLRDRLDAFGVPVFCLAGNHDLDGPFTEHLPGGNVRIERAVDVDRWQFVFLDSNALGREVLADGTVRDVDDRVHRAHAAALLEADAAWLSETLGDGGDAPVMLWLHHPPVAHPLAAGLEARPFTVWLHAELAASGRVRGVAAGHIHNAYAAERAGVAYWTCPSGWLGLDFDARTHAPPGYRHFRFHPDGAIESTAHWIDDARYAERPPFPDWVIKVLAGAAAPED